MGTEKKRLERLHAEVKSVGGLRAFFSRERVKSRLKAAFKNLEQVPPDLGCTAPPAGWWCSRPPGHDGPCAARRR